MFPYNEKEPASAFECLLSLFVALYISGDVGFLELPIRGWLRVVGRGAVPGAHSHFRCDLRGAEDAVGGPTRVGGVPAAAGLTRSAGTPANAPSANSRRATRRSSSRPGSLDQGVLPLDFDNRLRLGQSLWECKSELGQSGQIDRLSWLSGLQKFLAVERAVFVRPSISQRGQIVAQRLGLQILDVPTLWHRETAHAGAGYADKPTPTVRISSSS